MQCEVEEVERENDRGMLIAAVTAECSRCGHKTEAFGTSRKSVLRCLALMREECPKNESNFYVDEDDADV